MGREVRSVGDGVGNGTVRMRGRMPRTMLSVALAAALATAACAGGEGGDGAWEGEVTDSAGIPVVQNPARGLWAPADAWTVEEVFRVGGMDADTALQFGSVFGVDVDGAGHVLVLDQQVPTVRVFDADGGLTSRIGTPGQGPGELGRAVMGVFEEGGEVRIPDVANARISVYALDGTFIENVPFNPMEGIPIRWDEDGDGRVAVQRRTMTMENGAPVMGGSGDVVVTLGLGAVPTDTLATLPAGQSFSMEGGRPRMVIFAPEPIWDLSANGDMATAVNSDFRIEIIRNGEVVRVVTRDYEPVPVTEAEQRDIIRMTTQLMEDMGQPPQVVEMMAQAMEFAENYPAFNQLLLATDGSLWVQRVRTAGDVPEGVQWSAEDMGSNEWEVFDGEGRYLGVVALPLRFQPLREVDGVLWGVDRDELDVQAVVGLRIIRGD